MGRWGFRSTIIALSHLAHHASINGRILNTCVYTDLMDWPKFTLTPKAPIATKVVCFSRILECLRRLYGKQCGPRPDCFHRSSLIWVHPVCFYAKFVSNVRQLFAASVMLGNYLQQTTSADDFFRCIFSWHFKGYICNRVITEFTCSVNFHAFAVG